MKEIFKTIELVAFDFDGVFTDNYVKVDQNGVESVRCCRSDGIGLAKLRDLGVKLVIISTETNPVVSVRANKLKIDCIQGVEDKAEALNKICSTKEISLKNTAFVGNDINDIPAFRIAGIPIAVKDAYSEIFKHVIYRTKSKGGKGAVREICDLIYLSKTE
jgi:YrbI family 3-deoxy-D-manno-octulosonate 8-phosphate phosphatase